MPALRVHHLNCGTLRPPGGRLVNGSESPRAAARLVCHCLVVETEQGLILVDAGFGERDLGARGRGHRLQLRLLGAALGEDQMPAEDWKDALVKGIKALGVFSTIFSASIGCYGFWLGWHTFNYQQQVDLVMVLISFWMLIFGVIGVMAECKADMWKQMGFLASRFGRG